MHAALFAILLSTQPWLPPVEDVHRFPPLSVLDGQENLAIAYRRHVTTQCENSYYADRRLHNCFTLAKCEAEQRCNIYYRVRVAAWYSEHLTDGANDYYTHQIRVYLAEARELLGPAAYYRGILPPPVPIHLFIEVRGWQPSAPASSPCYPW